MGSCPSEEVFLVGSRPSEAFSWLGVVLVGSFPSGESS